MQRSPDLRSLLVASIASLILVAPASAQVSLDPNLQIENFVSGLNRPLALDWLAPDDILVVEYDTTRVRRVLNGVLLPTPVFELATSSVDNLAGIAINTESPPKVFLFVENQDAGTGNRLLRLDWNPTSGQLENPQTLLQLGPAAVALNQDNGGYLQLGPPDDPGNPPAAGDGQLLYVASGYGQIPGQLRNDPASVPPDDKGVILRLLQDGSPAPGNPFTPYCSATTTTTCTNDAGCPGGETCLTQVAKYWSYGVRNCFGMDIDPITGELWDQENGENENDEINRVPAGMNSGWSRIMGPAPAMPPVLFEMPGGNSFYKDPEYTWADTSGPTGIAFPLGSSFGAAYDDTILMADVNSPSQLYAFPLDSNRMALDLADIFAENQTELDGFAIATGFGGGAVTTEFGPDGSLYIVTHFDGTIWRITGPGPSAPAVPLLTGAGHALLFLLVAALGAVGIRQGTTVRSTH